MKWKERETCILEIRIPTGNIGEEGRGMETKIWIGKEPKEEKGGRDRYGEEKRWREKLGDSDLRLPSSDG